MENVLGIAANVAQVISVIVPALLWKMVNCHTPWCWRHGKHPVEGTGYKVCDSHNKPHHHNRLRKLLHDR